MGSTHIPIPLSQPFLPKWLQGFADNEFQNITERTLRNFATDIDTSFVAYDKLTTNMVRGATFRVPYLTLAGGVPLVDIDQVPARLRIVSMEIMATNGVTASEAAAGVRADPVYFRLLAYPTGPIDALVDEQSTTTATVKARLVRTSGTEEQRQAGFELLELEDHPYLRGEVVKYVFPSGATRLLEWRADSVGFQHPVPTGRDDDPIYAPYAPYAPAGAGGGSVGLTSTSTHSTTQGLRNTGPIFLYEKPAASLSVLDIDNIDTHLYQVNYLNAAGGFWQVGAWLQTIADANAALQAVPAAKYAYGVQLRIKTVPLDNTLEANFALVGAGPGWYVGNARPFLVTYTGPPLGTINANSRFQEALQPTGTQNPVPGWVGNPARVSMGGGIMTMVGSGAGDIEDLKSTEFNLTVRQYKAIINVNRLDSNSILSVAFRFGGNSFPGVQYVTALGETILYFTPDQPGAWRIYAWGMADGELGGCDVLPV